MWTTENNQLVKHFVFSDFLTAFAFMSKVAEIAEEQNHHPYWTNVYNKVSIYLTTHDQQNTITEKDQKLAMAIDLMYGKEFVKP